MLTSDIPAPERASVMLAPDLRDHRGRPIRFRDAQGRQRFTLHHYVRTEETHPLVATTGDRVGRAIENGDPDDVAYRFIFVCSETGAERVYGYDGPDTRDIPRDDVEEC